MVDELRLFPYNPDIKKKGMKERGIPTNGSVLQTYVCLCCVLQCHTLEQCNWMIMLHIEKVVAKMSTRL